MRNGLHLIFAFDFVQRFRYDWQSFELNTNHEVPFQWFRRLATNLLNDWPLTTNRSI